MISCPPLTRQTAARSSKTNAFVLCRKGRENPLENEMTQLLRDAVTSENNILNVSLSKADPANTLKKKTYELFSIFLSPALKSPEVFT